MGTCSPVAFSYTTQDERRIPQNICRMPSLIIYSTVPTRTELHPGKEVSICNITRHALSVEISKHVSLASIIYKNIRSYACIAELLKSVSKNKPIFSYYLPFIHSRTNTYNFKTLLGHLFKNKLIRLH